MLQSLHIHNFALIEDLQLTLSTGVSIFTGETGAGKSILLDAIGMLAGKRASASFVRHGAEAFLVEGAFFFAPCNTALTDFLAVHHIECEDGELIISRQFHRNGRGSVLINGTLVPLTTVRQIGSYLLDIHGQFDNQLIFDPSYHVRILDSLTTALQAERRRYDGLYRKWRDVVREADELRKNDREKMRLLSVLNFQIREIEDSQLKRGEDEALEETIRKAAHAEHITENLRSALYLLEGSDRQQGLVEGIGDLQRSLAKASAYDEFFTETADKAESLAYEFEELQDRLMRYASSFDFDAAALDKMQSRLAAIEKLKRKYGSTIEEIEAFLKQAKEEKDRLENAENRLAEMERHIAAAEKELRSCAALLQKLRSAAARLFSEQMQKTLMRLGMPKAVISFQVEEMTEITPIGAAAVELYFSANAGEAVQPLAKIASGGEVSRIALALKTAMHAKQDGKTVIFDEIDVGISGQTGLQVAAHIRQLRGDGQVLCITHLSQTAAIADHHYFLYKAEKNSRTVTQVKELSEAEHTAEIARMFAGDHVNEAGIEAARQIIAQVRDKS